MSHMLVILLIQSRLLALDSVPYELRVSGLSAGIKMKLYCNGIFLPYHSYTLRCVNI